MKPRLSLKEMNLQKAELEALHSEPLTAAKKRAISSMFAPTEEI